MKLILISTFFSVMALQTPIVNAQQPPKTQSATNEATEKAASTSAPPAKKVEQTINESTKKMTRDTPLKKMPPAKTNPVTSSHRPLKENEYSLDQNNKITIVKTKLYEGLLLSQDCFKKNSKKPTCEAYTKSLEKTPVKAEDAMDSPYHNNMGSIHCKLLGGTGLIVKSSQNNESDFCQFKDGSMVSSWTAYYKTTQVNTESQSQEQSQQPKQPSQPKTKAPSN